MPPTPTMERAAPTKKSLRIWVRNNGHVMRKKTKVSYVYPRTVEAAKDPFECATGKNKMFYLIAINLFPDTKIVRPDDSDSEVENEETNQIGEGCKVEESTSNSEPEVDKVDRKRKRAKRSPTVETVPPSPSGSSSPSESSHHQSPDKAVVPAVNSNPRPRNRKLISSKSSCQRQRLLPLKKTGVKTNTANLENACSKVSDCENNCLSSPESLGEAKNSHKAKGSGDPVVVSKGGPVPNSRKLPPIPTIMSSLNKIIETCSATGTVSFSLAKKKPRQSRS